MQRLREHGEKKALGGFDARFHCSHREYEYIFPVEAIRRLARCSPHSSPAEELSPEVVADRLAAACAEFVGSHHFHNFCHVPRIPNLRRYCRLAWAELPFTKEKLRESDEDRGSASKPSSCTPLASRS